MAIARVISKGEVAPTTVVAIEVAELGGAPSALEILNVCVELADFLIGKNKSYGDSALNPLRVFSKADALEQIRVRMDDKLNRMLKGSMYAGDNDAKDLVGYWVLEQICKARQQHLTRVPGQTDQAMIQEQHHNTCRDHSCGGCEVVPEPGAELSSPFSSDSVELKDIKPCDYVMLEWRRVEGSPFRICAKGVIGDLGPSDEGFEGALTLVEERESRERPQG